MRIEIDGGLTIEINRGRPTLWLHDKDQEGVLIWPDQIEELRDALAGAAAVLASVSAGEVEEVEESDGDNQGQR